LCFIMKGTLYEIALSLRNFERFVGKCNSKQISQSAIDKFILQGGTEVSRPTLNKDIRNLKTFINWCKKKRYINNQIELRELKEEEKPVRSLNSAEIKKLLKATEPYPSIKIRVLLALATGLRRGDIDSLKICDIDFEKNSISTKSRKTKKSMGSRPVSGEIMAELSKYVRDVDVGQEKLFKTKFSHRKWRKTCKDAGLTDLKFHDLRRTFCSLLAQNGISTAVTQKLLEHSSPDLTNKIYTNVDPVLRYAVEQLPVGEWL